MRTFKQQLAWEIVSIFHGDKSANQAREDARRMYKGEAPSDTPTYPLTETKGIIEILYDAQFVKSKGEARRLIQQKGVRIDGEVVGAIDQTVKPPLESEIVIQMGKRKFLRVING